MTLVRDPCVKYINAMLSLRLEGQIVLISSCFLRRFFEGRSVYQGDIRLLPFEQFPDRHNLDLGILPVQRLVEASLHRFGPHGAGGISQGDILFRAGMKF